MVNIILCGSPGSRKSDIARGLISKYKNRFQDHKLIDNIAAKELLLNGIHGRKDYNKDDRRFISVQEQIVERACIKEKKVVENNKEFITANSIIDGLVLLTACLETYTVVETLLAKPNVQTTVERYRNSLVVLLNPVKWQYDDGICLRLKKDDWLVVKGIYVELFLKQGIPFIDLREESLDEILSEIRKASSGEIRIDSDIGRLYQENTLQTDRPRRQASRNFDDNLTIQNNFSFFLRVDTHNMHINIPTIKLNDCEYKQDWTKFPVDQTNRFISRFSHERLICLHFDIKVKSKTAQELLIKGVKVNGQNYEFLGCSASGIKERKCYMWKGTQFEVKDILKQCGDFNEIKTVSKYLARISLLFSTVQFTSIEINDHRIIMDRDIEHAGYVFSDGCGSIGRTLAKELVTQLRDKPLDSNYVPSVFQVRFQGYKGVLAIDPSIDADSILVRPSMKKFDTNMFPKLGVCGFSKPYTFGHLNKQFIQLLSSLGVPDCVFESKQREYLDDLKNIFYDPEKAIRILQWQNMFEIAQEILQANGNQSVWEQANVTKTLRNLQTRLLTKVEKLNIIVPESRNLYGVCDQSGTLAYGQCFLRVTIGGKPVTISGQVVVCKNPCYLRGDVRVLTAVSYLNSQISAARNLDHLVDCIVFPTEGIRPHADEIAGSDLDGDQFFVAWDPEIIPEEVRPPYDYPSVERRPEGTITPEKIYSYFTKQNEVQKMMGRVDKLFNMWADRNGVGSVECERLGQLFSRVVDASKTGDLVEIPKALCTVEPVSEIDAAKTYVWVRMKLSASALKDEFKSRTITEPNLNMENISDEFIYDMAYQAQGNITECDKFTFLFRYLTSTTQLPDEIIECFLDLYGNSINFSLFTTAEKQIAIESGIPVQIVMNALNRSCILRHEELKFFEMDRPSNAWHFIAYLDAVDFRWEYIKYTLTTNEKSLIVFRLQDDVIFELQVIGKLVENKEPEKLNGGNISAVLYSRHFGYKRKYILGNEYWLDFSGHTLQLYRDQDRTKTFIWLQGVTNLFVSEDERTLNNKSSPSHPTSRSRAQIQNKVRNAISVDLQRFDRRIFNSARKHPKVNKMEWVEIEIYAQTEANECPYLDVYQVNDLLPVKEEDEPETMSAREDDDTIYLLFKEHMHAGEDCTSENMFVRLSEAASKGDFFCFLETLKAAPKYQSSEVVHAFSSLLQNVLQIIAPVTLTEDFSVCLAEIFDHIKDILFLNEPHVVLIIFASLCRLGFDPKVMVSVFDCCISPCTLQDFLTVVEKWECFYFLDHQLSVAFLEHLVLCINMDCENKVSFERDVHDYIVRFGQLHVIHLLGEIHACRELFKEEDSSSNQSCIRNLKFDRTADSEDGVLSMYRTGALDSTTRITRGQFVAIMRQSYDKDPEKRRVCCLAQVISICVAPLTLTLKIEGSIPHVVTRSMQNNEVRFWRVELIGNIVTYLRVVTSMKSLIGGSDSLPEVFKCITSPAGFETTPSIAGVPISAPIEFAVDVRQILPSGHETTIYSRTPSTPSVSIETELNVSQTYAVNQALLNPVTLIQGPPGTGKTKVACHIVKEVLKKGGIKPILVVAETNVAVDNITRRLQNEVFLVRIGPAEGISCDLYDLSLEGQVKRIAEREAKKDVIRDAEGLFHRNTRLINLVLSKADVILTTCAGAGDKCLENMNFSFVLVDEATQTLETTILCCLSRGMKQMVMIGDPVQLGPTIVGTGYYSSPNLYTLNDLKRTLFHRLYECRLAPICFLDTQYRMHSEIARFPASEFYGNKLKTPETVNKRTAIVFQWPKSNTPLCFVNVNGIEKRSGTSYCNMAEAQTVSTIVDMFLNDVDEEKDREKRIGIEQIGVITLYRGQVVALKNAVRKGVMISTVDGFQGQEKDLIVVSTVLNNDNGHIGFAGDPNRINVLLTRAKRALVIVGSKKTLNNSALWSKWIDQAPVFYLKAC
ncbi:uncharacterized protein LOC127868002 isoform X1 [Dreissena polymorpha]|uniref:Helicase ATP-binding domain-containing protein n=1 Tax=Dreissena polymorpha TaxID=45954 RepID=A0A9D4M325_DREPO|nr:uncharacterized protein LOC127868002 isoform X1 [Dreissena polymorpha]XP_052265512.1 uncharacterized protein LOC127868002 isoform X1 [Dreissena polymorpha]XP_052265513.1 uncharacterized protein LOC127868002 isoform X1 [Dreissena polymorpha]XP_052265514.1 uncharacterized protein LOC127868002 isoform X1 [Dreissena polymorpha]XP_052265515.1 uncharacterized protein LOC127868002 isoform X1 [Dreissena polymorpha]KAH3869363.1 hypothetical protein DPMN_032526 [Dreissena polymorpha]